MIHFGIDNLLLQTPRWKNKNIALVTNQAATTASGILSRVALIQQSFNLVKLFSPEHGLDVKGADGKLMYDGTDVITSLPVISLYNNKLAPAIEDLANIEIVLFDIPDIGARFYTYVWTMTYVMESCAKAGKKLVLLDRPNPVSGNMQLCEGPMLEQSQASFIGRWNIPVRHCCTLGELALYFNDCFNIKCDLEIITCSGWNRNMFQPEWNLPFVATSPAIRQFNSMLLYPGLCLLEATNISEGRGTEFSFCAAGAPWLNATQLKATLTNLLPKNISISTLQFTSADADSKFYLQTCNAINFTVTDINNLNPVITGLMILYCIKKQHPQEFRWAPYPTIVNPGGLHHLDKLLGIYGSENLFDLPLQEFKNAISQSCSCSEWPGMVKPYLLYH